MVLQSLRTNRQKGRPEAASSAIASDGPASIITGLYQGLLGRAPDEMGLRHHLAALTAGTVSLQDIVFQFACSPEFQAKHGSPGKHPLEAFEVRGCSKAEAMEVFGRFQRYDGPGRAGFITNFLGGLTDTGFVGLQSHSGLVEGYPIPRNFHADTLEWFGTLRAVQEASGTFRMIELGAGWAPWCTVGYLAALQRGLRPDVMAVEGDAGHIRFIEESFATNGHDPGRCTILHGIVGAQDGTASFPRSKDASRVYGSAAAFGAGGASDDPFRQLIKYQADLFEGVDLLKCYGLAKLLGDYGRIDLLHCDIQGAEADIFEASIEELNKGVAWIIVGTHSFDIDRRLIRLLADHGWRLEGFDSVRMTGDGEALRLVGDGTQVWRNMRL